MALSSAQGEGGRLGPMDDAGTPGDHPADAQQAFDGGQTPAPEASEAADTSFQILSQPAEGQVMDNGDGTFSFDTGGDFQDLAIGEARQVSFTLLLERSEVVTATVTVTATPEGPVAQDVSYANEPEAAPQPTAGGAEPPLAAAASDPAPVDPAPFDAAPLTDLNALEFAEPEPLELEFEAPAMPEPAIPEPRMPAPVMAEPGLPSDQDSPEFGAAPAPPLGDLDFVDAPADHFGASMPETEGDHPHETPPAMELGGADLAAEASAAQDSGAEGEIEIISQPEAGTVSNNSDGTFSFDPGDAFQDLADGETRDVSFTLRLADGAIMTAIVTVVGDPAGPLARDVAFQAQEEVQEEAPAATAEPQFDAPISHASAFEASLLDGPSFEEPPLAAPVPEAPSEPQAVGAPPSPFDAFSAFDRPSAPVAAPDKADDIAAEPAFPSDEPADFGDAFAAPSAMEPEFSAPVEPAEPALPEPALEAPGSAAEDFFGGELDSSFGEDQSASPGHPPAEQASEAPMIAFETEPGVTPLSDLDPLPDGESAGGNDFGGFSDFGAAAASEAPAGLPEPLEVMAEPMLDQDFAAPSAPAAAPEPALGDFGQPFGEEPAMPAASAPVDSAPAATPEPYFETPAASGDEDFIGMDGARRVDTLQLSGVTAGPGVGGWNIELSSGQIVDIQDGCVVLSAGSAGTLVLDDSSVRVSFDGIERIVW